MCVKAAPAYVNPQSTGKQVLPSTLQEKTPHFGCFPEPLLIPVDLLQTIKGMKINMRLSVPRHLQSSWNAWPNKR